ncbi:MAG: hypothetical protein SO366_00085 [Atopobiaceae bacterium]|nr:hypothetical protein [Atopobiaceae bacterium]
MKQERSPEEREALYLKAAAYFEKQHDAVMAVRCYDPCGRHAKVIQLLERHAREDPRHGHFRELEPCYLAVPEDEAKGSPVLMMGLSMVSFLRADFDVSRSWYERLCAYAACPGHSLEKQKQLEADTRYLDIACLVRSADSVIDLMSLIAQGIDVDEPAYRSFTFSARAHFLPSSMAAVTSAPGRPTMSRSIASLQSRSSVHWELMAPAFLTVPLPRAPFSVARMCVPGCWASRRGPRTSISMALPISSSLRQDCLPARR